MNQAVPEELLRDLSTRGFDALFEPAAGTGSNTPLGTASTNGFVAGSASGGGAAGANAMVGTAGGAEGIGADAGGAAGVGIGTADGAGGADTENIAATWTLRAASEKMGLSPNTIRKRIRTGELRADKVIGLNGPEWRIQPPLYSAGGSSGTAGGASAIAGAYGAGTPGTAAYGADTPGAFAGTDAITASNFSTLDALLKVIETQAKQLEVATTQLAVSTEQVKAATRVIAYQQLQLEEKDNKVKLLTDSRHREGWLQKLARQFKRD